MANKYLRVVFLSVISAGAVGRAADDLVVRGQVLDDAGRPIAGAQIDYFWSGNGTGKHDDGTAIDLESEDGPRIFWSNVGKMEPRHLTATSSGLDGAFTFTLPDFSHAIMAMDEKRERGGLFFVDRSRPLESAKIALDPLVRVHARFEGPSGDKPPYWTHAYVLTPEDARRPLDTRRLVHCGSFERRFEVSLPPGKYLLEAYGQSTSDEDLDLRVVQDREFVVKSGIGALDLGVLKLEPCTSLQKRIETAKRKGTWGDFRDHYGETPPQWHVTDARGVPADVQPSDFRGKWILVEFWGLGCRACLRDSLPKLMRFYEEHAAHRARFEVLAVCIDIDAELKTIADVDRALEPVVQHAWGGKKLPFPVLLDPTFITWERYGLRGLGTMILIDPDGKLIRGDESTLGDILAAGTD